MPRVFGRYWRPRSKEGTVPQTAGLCHIIIMAEPDKLNEGFERDVAQPPPAVTSGSLSNAKPAQTHYRRNLPHIQQEEKPVFVTFTTYKRWELPVSVRDLVMKHCLHDHGNKLVVHGIVVMPDHVHLVISPLRDEQGDIFGLAEIMNGIKGASAHSINRFLDRKGRVWQDESFDHVLRSDEKINSKVIYLCENPVRKGLVSSVDEYPWLWREWVEGEGTVPQTAGPCYIKTKPKYLKR
ncbi:MAG: transposase [Deltaproteobacteria bacterium]|nr:transposase [Deltaproteobacteria bacterium]